MSRSIYGMTVRGMVVALMALILFAMPGDVFAANSCSAGIKGNGTGGIYIDINAAPYNTIFNANQGGWEKYAYSKEGCAWFASARVRQLTGKGNVIHSGYAWYYNCYSAYGFTRGNAPRAGALACYANHVAVVEDVNGDTITVSQGGVGRLSDSEHGYCIISTMSRAKLESQGGCGVFYGYVYLDEVSDTPQESLDPVTEAPSNTPEDSSVSVAEAQSNTLKESSTSVTKVSSHKPEGCLDSVTGGTESISVSGWAFDRDVPGQELQIHVYVGGPAGSGAPGYPITANDSRPDVNEVYQGIGNQHGFNSTIPVSQTGQQDIYVYAINVGGGDNNPLIGKKTVTIEKANVPEGSLDFVTGGTESISVSGWAFDLDVPGQELQIHVYVGGPAGSGAPGYSITANTSRPDMKAVYPEIGEQHGFHSTIPVSQTGQQDIYVYAINAGDEDNNPLIGKKTVTIGKDAEKPKISNLKIKLDEGGYCITGMITQNGVISRLHIKLPAPLRMMVAAAQLT